MRSTLAALLPLLLCSAPATAGDLLVTSWNNSSIRCYDDQTGAFKSVFVPSGSGGLSLPHSAQFGPDGNLYVATRGANPGILRFDGQSGAFIDQFIGPTPGLTGTETGNFGPDGHYYLSTGPGNSVFRYDGQTGDFIDVFVTPTPGNLNDPHDLVWGPDGDLYVSSFGANRVKRYDGQTGAFINNFVTVPGGLSSPHGIDFRPDGLVYVTSFAGNNVRRYDADTGQFVDTFVTNGSGGLNGPISLTFRDEDTLNLSVQENEFHAFLAEPAEDVLFLLGRPAPAGLQRFAFERGPGTLASSCADNPFLLPRYVVVAHGQADSGGRATARWRIPASLSGTTLLMQAVTPASCRASDVQLYTVP